MLPTHCTIKVVHFVMFPMLCYRLTAQVVHFVMFPMFLVQKSTNILERETGHQLKLAFSGDLCDPKCTNIGTAKVLTRDDFMIFCGYMMPSVDDNWLK